MSRFRLDRRTLLRGSCGVALALPPLEIMARVGSARAAAPPRRFFLSYGGSALGRDNNPANRVVPTTAGRSFTPSRAMQPMVASNAIKDVSIVSGLKLPFNGPAHTPASAVAQLSGTSAPPSTTHRFPTAEFVAADLLGAGRLHQTLSLRVQARAYFGTYILRLSCDKTLKTVEPFVSPQLLFQSLFSGFAAPTASGAPKLDLLLRQRRSVLDVVGNRAQALARRLGAQDRQRLEKHTQEVRDLETRLAPLSTPPGSACRAPADPGEDPPINEGTRSPSNKDYQESTGYSGEEARATVMVDLVHLALACDLTRSVCLMWTNLMSMMNMKPLTGKLSDMHELGHSRGTPEDVADAVGWHFKHFGRLVGKLRDTPEVDGSSLLDQAALVLVMEAGHGHDTSGKDFQAHSFENMIALVGGRAGGLKPGQHVLGMGRHPAQAVISALRAVGLGSGRLGDVQGDIPELFNA
jgi:hypothetical protein